MRVFVAGSTGCIGTAVVHALRARGHVVVCGARCLRDGETTLHLDFMHPREPAQWAQRLIEARIDAVVNCVGMLMPSRTQSFERVHAHGPIELFRGAAQAGVRRVVQVSALGVGRESADVPYIATKLQADDALAGLPIEHAIVRPSLVYGPRSQSAALFAALASLPVVSLPGRGAQRVQPIHVYEVAEAIARLIEQREPVRGVFDLAGPVPVSYREMLAAYRRAMGLGEPLWLPVPMPLMTLGAIAAQWLPQKVYSRDTLRLLERGNTSARNAAPALLRRAPSSLAEGLRVTPPQPLIDLRVQLSPAADAVLRASVAFMWLYTAFITALLPQQSGVLRLLERCGFEGDAGVAVMLASCTLNTLLGVLMLRRPAPWVYALQIGAVLGYTATAALNMPELTIDHCGPLVKNVPLLALLALLWLAERSPRVSALGSNRGLNNAQRAQPTLPETGALAAVADRRRVVV
jgi:nucleoside-diphosphate-sugar epimerase